MIRLRSAQEKCHSKTSHEKTLAFKTMTQERVPWRWVVGRAKNHTLMERKRHAFVVICSGWSFCALHVVHVDAKTTLCLWRFLLKNEWMRSFVKNGFDVKATKDDKKISVKRGGHEKSNLKCFFIGLTEKCWDRIRGRKCFKFVIWVTWYYFRA